MRKIRQRILSSLLVGAMLLSMCGTAFAAEPTPGSYTDIDGVTQAAINYTQSAQIPLEGWYNKNLESGRTVKMYVPEYAACRAYFTVVAAPNGVTDVQSWASDQGYVNLMDQRGEVLVVLEPADATAGWQDLTTELAYVTAAMTFVNAGKNSSNVALFTNYSTFYLVGYEAGAAPLEAWAVDHPILVGSQAYLNGESAGSEYLTTVGDKTYDGTNTGGYDPGIADVDEFKQVLGEHGYTSELIARKDVPVPTWFVGYASDDPSLAYWKEANDCVGTPVGDVYWQAKDSNAFQTEYANSCTAEDHGISQVKVSASQTVTADELAGFLYGYTRYNVPFAYSNHLSERQDYAAIRVAAQAAAKSAGYLTDEQKVTYDQPITSDAGDTYTSYYELARERETVGQGKVESGILAFSDDNGDGNLDAREYLMYIPDSAVGKAAPIVFQFPGNTQSVAVGFDSTQWWRVANDQGVIVVILSEAYNNGGVALTWKNSDMAYRAVRDMLEKDPSISIDWTRVYGSGHSLGSMQVQTFVHSHPDFFAAVGSTSFGNGTSTSAYEPVPTMLLTGQSDLPFLMSNLWTSDSLKSWFSYLAEANGLKVTSATADNADAKAEGTARTWTYTWNNSQEIPMVVWGQTYLREHNCYPAEVPMLWNFISHYKLTGVGTRDYSASAFAASDNQQIAVPDVSRGAAAQKFYNYFNWSHRDEYNDIWAPDMPHFNDVTENDSHWMAIECALQQGVISVGTGNFNPTANLTYADAISMLSNAFSVPTDDIIAQLNNIHSGYTDTDAISNAEWNALFTAVSNTYVSPVQALPIANSDAIAPRRYVKLWTPTKDTTIYFKKTVSTTGYDENITLNISEAPAYNTTDKTLLDATKTTQIYTVNEDGYIKEDYPSNPDTYVTYKVMAVDKDGKQSAERVYKWHLQRPTDSDLVNGDYQYTLMQAKTATSPAVYQICRDAEFLRPMAWYIEGQNSGVVVDALFTNASTDWNMKEFIDGHMATKPYVLVIGHAHPDHDAQVANFVNAGITTYCNDRGWNNLRSLLTVSGEPEATTYARQALVKSIDEGDSFNLGGCTLDVYALPGHEDSLVVLADKANGLLFATDIYGCTRAGSADNVNVAGIRADLLLSLAQQNRANYENTGVPVKEIFTGHDELPLDHNLLVNFEKALQQVIDKGDAATSYTLRGNNNAMYARTTMVGDMWKDGTNWISLMLGGIKGDQTAYLSSASEPYMNTTPADTAINSTLNYNFVNGVQQYKTYSVLSNVAVTGGQLNGVDLTWKASANITWAGQATTVNYTLHDKFNPWHYDYTISVPSSSSKITIDATAMSSLAKITSISLNGVAQNDLTDLPVSNGSVVTVVVTAQDGHTTSTYNFTMMGDLDDVTNLQKDFTQAAQLPLTGYYTKNIDVNGNGTMDDNRTVKVYIAPEASIRSYFTVVAVPDGVDTYQFLNEQGWIDLANKKGEGLFILEPGSGGWGTPEDEDAYLNKATAFLRSGNNVNAQNVFSTFGEFYLVGYGNGASALERWAAQNPILVISQAFVDGTSVGSDSLTSVAGTLYNGASSGYGDISSVLPAMLTQVGIDGEIAPKDVPVPTWMMNYTGSEGYWKTANDCVSTAVGDVFYQDINSDAYQTNYANQQRKAAGETYGISQVKVSGSALGAEAIYAFLSAYTRYDNTFAYANAIADRLDYTAARVAAQQDAKDGVVNTTLSDGTQILAQNNVSIDGHGTVQVGVMAFSDNNGDGKVDPREYLLYIPKGFEAKDLPVLMIYPGNTQTDSIFLDSTLWWQVAEEKGVALAFVCETYNASPSSVSHADSDKFYASLMTLLKEKIDGKLANLDFTRVYGSGQSAGSMATQGFAFTNPEFFAAVASTSGTPLDFATGTPLNPNVIGANHAIPDLLISGQMDILDLANGFDSVHLQSWATYLLKVNGVGDTFAADKATSITNVDSRHPEVYTWSKTVNGTQVPMFQWAQCLLRSHNCYPSDIPMMWDFLEHYSFVKGTNGSLTRYYSPSAFTKNDAMVIDYIAGTSTGGSGSSVSKQGVSVKTTQNGSITTNIANAVKGSEVTITVTPKTGYELTSLKVTTTAGVELTLTNKGNGQYTFTMPDAAVIVTGAFAAAETKLPYTDAAKGAWYYDAVVFAYEKGLMSGMGDNTFAPNQQLSRAMIAQILYRLESTPATTGTSFTDVQDGQWYADAVTWAVQNKIVSGYGAGKFGPDDSITREQLAAILYSYVQYKTPGTTASGSLDAFRDGDSASDWAVESLVWAVNQGLMSGKTGNMLDPKGTATRAEVAQVLMKFLQTK